MNERQKEILNFLINEYIKFAQPIGSSLLSKKAGMDLSSATYRNEMSELENEGYLIQPHTSSGRIPTEKAYQYYVEKNFIQKDFDISTVKSFKLSIRKELKEDQLLKDIAKQLVEKSDQAVILAIDKNNSYYTGLSNLLAKPEFQDQESILSISSVVDHLDEVIDEVFDGIDDLKILIGKNNPFGSSCSVIIIKYKLKNHLASKIKTERYGMFAILGPIRMDYKKNIKLINEVKLLIESINNKN